MKLFKKKRGRKTTEYVVNDIKEAFSYLIAQKTFPTCKNSIYSITTTHTGCKHEKDLNHVITNRLFNNIKSDYKNSCEHTNYLFVIEFPEVISIGNYLPNNCNIHAHIVLNTSLTEETILKYTEQAFSIKKSNLEIVIEDITFRNDREKYKGYLVKQGINNYILSDSSYNYKITKY